MNVWSLLSRDDFQLLKTTAKSHLAIYSQKYKSRSRQFEFALTNCFNKHIFIYSIEKCLD